MHLDMHAQWCIPAAGTAVLWRCRHMVQSIAPGLVNESLLAGLLWSSQLLLAVHSRSPAHMPACPQDWMNYNTPGLELTMELHVVKDPPASTLAGMWQQNVGSLLRYMEVVWLGLDARLATRASVPLNGTVSITRPAGWRNTWPRVSSTQDGRFFLMLAPDTLYCIRVQPSGAGATWQPIILAVQLQGSASRIISGSGLAGLAVPANLTAARRSGSELPVRLALGAATAAMASSC